MSDVQTLCPQGMRADQVSAFYDDELDATATAALREHLATCDVCQRRLSDYAHISATLRGQTVPQPDARLRRSILAARAQATPSLARLGWARDAWRAATIAAAVILIVSSIAALLLNRATVTRIGAPTITPTQADSAPTITPAPSATSFPAAPAGWRAILPTRRFAGGGSQGFAVSAARPGRLVGCGLPGVTTDAWPYPALAISDDGGQTWKESVFQEIGTVSDCSVVVDQLHPDTIIVGNADGSKLAVTTDAGQTWRPLPLPAGMAMNFTLAGSSNSLVNGQLIGVFHNISGSGRYALGDLSITGAFWMRRYPIPRPQ